MHPLLTFSKRASNEHVNTLTDINVTHVNFSPVINWKVEESFDSRTPEDLRR